MLILTALAVLLALGDTVWARDVYRMSVKDESRLNVGPGTFSFARQYQDHMVLQQAPASATVYGFAAASDIGQKVTVTLTTSAGPKTYETTVVQGRNANSGEWLVTLDPTTGGESATVQAALGSSSLSLTDVLFGDVWICSGQSNMEMTVVQMLDADQEVADSHNYPDIRVMTIANVESATPASDIAQITQSWTKADNASIGGPAWQYFSAVCWVFGRSIYKARNYPIGLISSDWGGTPVEAWSSTAALQSCGVVRNEEVHQPETYRNYLQRLSPKDRHRLQGPGDNSVLWNGMIYPLVNMTIYGAVWYQGESDSGGVQMNRYNCTFPAMIRDWRKNFNEASKQTSASFPFGFVQLAPNNPNPAATVGFPDIRWHQTADHGFVPNSDMPNTFMSVAMDLPDYQSTYGAIHPRDKKDVGERLALSGRVVAYGENNLVSQGPFPQTLTRTADNGVKVDYGTAWSLDIRDPNGFEYQCTPFGQWVATTIQSNDQTSVTLEGNKCNSGQTVTSLRYAWRESPCDFMKCAVYESVNSLPAPPFVLNVP